MISKYYICIISKFYFILLVLIYLIILYILYYIYLIIYYLTIFNLNDNVNSYYCHLQIVYIIDYVNRKINVNEKKLIFTNI